jgi:hypothetical protein
MTIENLQINENAIEIEGFSEWNGIENEFSLAIQND